jgi:hypothetical protein
LLILGEAGTLDRDLVGSDRHAGKAVAAIAVGLCVRVSLVKMFRIVTVAPVMTACFSSFTSPEIDPEVCAKAGQQRQMSNAVISNNSLVTLIISILPFWND